MKEIHFTAQLPNRSDIGALVEPDPSPVLSDYPRKNLLNNVVLNSNIGGRCVWKPQVCFAELLKPHLQIVQSVATRQRRIRENVVGVQIGFGLGRKGFT